MKSSHSLAVVCSTRSRSVERNQLRAGRSQCSNVPRSPLHPVNAPLTSMSTVTLPPAGSSMARKRIASLGPVGSHSTSPLPSRARANSIVASRASLRLAWTWPRLIASSDRSMSCQLKPTSPTPPLTSACTYTAKIGMPRLGSLVLDQEPLDVLAGRLFPARVQGQAIAHRGEVGDQDLDRPVPPGQLGRQEVGRPLVLLIGVPGGPLGEPVEPAADGEAADDPAEMAAALRQVAFPGTDVGMKADRREINVVGRAPGIDPDRHQSVADQPFGSHEQGIDRFGAVRQVGPHDRVLIGALGGDAIVALDDRAIMEPDADRLGRNRRVPEAVAPFVLDPVGRQQPQREIVGRKFQRDSLVVLDRVSSDHGSRPHPRSDGPAQAAFRRRFDPGRQYHSMASHPYRRRTLRKDSTRIPSVFIPRWPEGTLDSGVSPVGAPRGGRFAERRESARTRSSTHLVDRSERDNSGGRFAAVTRRWFTGRKAREVQRRPRSRCQPASSRTVQDNPRGHLKNPATTRPAVVSLRLAHTGEVNGSARPPQIVRSCVRRCGAISSR